MVSEGMICRLILRGFSFIGMKVSELDVEVLFKECLVVNGGGKL